MKDKECQHIKYNDIEEYLKTNTSIEDELEFKTRLKNALNAEKDFLDICM